MSSSESSGHLLLYKYKGTLASAMFPVPCLFDSFVHDSFILFCTLYILHLRGSFLLSLQALRPRGSSKVSSNSSEKADEADQFCQFVFLFELKLYWCIYGLGPLEAGQKLSEVNQESLQTNVKCPYKSSDNVT